MSLCTCLPLKGFHSPERNYIFSKRETLITKQRLVAVVSLRCKRQNTTHGSVLRCRHEVTEEIVFHDGKIDGRINKELT